MFRVLPVLFFSLHVIAAGAAESGGAISAGELAARVNAKQEGSSYVRVRMSSASSPAPLQLQIKSRVSRGSAEILYQVLFPKERKGEAVLLRRSGNRMSGIIFTPPNGLRELGAAQLDAPLFGSDLSCEDIIDSPFAWEQQAIVGTEVIDGTECQILESKPGKGSRSSYASVRTWIDPRRAVPLRIEKYGDSGKVVRRISTTRILLDGGDSLPANLRVYGPRGSVTELDGSRIKRGMSFPDETFSVEGLRELSAPRNAPD
jgi:hypothetical protein